MRGEESATGLVVALVASLTVFAFAFWMGVRALEAEHSAALWYGMNAASGAAAMRSGWSLLRKVRSRVGPNEPRRPLKS